jgi:hypothetical protein
MDVWMIYSLSLRLSFLIWKIGTIMSPLEDLRKHENSWSDYVLVSGSTHGQWSLCMVSEEIGLHTSTNLPQLTQFPQFTRELVRNWIRTSC